MGGGGGSSDTQVFQPPIRQDTPLQQGLTGLATSQLNTMIPYMPYGAGYQLMPMTPFGQTYMPGPNQTIFGNPYNQQNSVPFFGQPAQAPTNYGFQPNQGAGAPFWQQPTPYGQVSAPFQQYFGNILPQSGTGAPGQAPPQGNYPYLPGTGPAPALPQAPQQPQPEQTGPNTPNNPPPAPPPPAFNTSQIGGDPFGIAAGNAPVGPDGNPQNLDQMQQLLQQMAFLNSLNQPQGQQAPQQGVK